MNSDTIRKIIGLMLLLLPCCPGIASAAEGPFGDNVVLRGNLDNCRIKFLQEKRGTVAFIGGSITEGDHYRPLVCKILQKRFPDTAFKFINAGISSTTSVTGAFRVETDVIAQGPIDLLFVEFAVNDDQDGHYSREECIRGMEGLIRHARAENPHIDIVMTFFVNEGMLSALQGGKTPLTIETHEAIAKYYQVSTINVARETAQEISAGSLTWKQYGGVHPAPFGDAICARMIDELLNRAWKKPLAKDAVSVAHTIPADPIDPFCYQSGRFLDITQAVNVGGWTLGVPDWAHLPGGKRDRFIKMAMLSATSPGADLTLNFEGTAIGAFVVAGPDAGMLESSIDRSPFASVNLYHNYSSGLHYPRTVLFASDLKPGKHALELRVSSHTSSSGHAARIIQFVAN